MNGKVVDEVIKMYIISKTHTSGKDRPRNYLKCTSLRNDKTAQQISLLSPARGVGEW